MNEIVHGSVSSYTNHGCRCDECKSAASDYQRERRAAHKSGAKPIVGRGGDVPHGTVGGYTNHGCRCAMCRSAVMDYNDGKTYGIPIGTRQQMFSAQGNKCAACGITDEEFNGRWHIDHDHETGVVRGILCHGCNVSLGFASENPARLRALADYIERVRWV